MTILELIQKTALYFEKAGVPNPRLDIELLLAHALGLKRMDLYLQFERKLEETELEKLRSMVKRRAAREPLQYIVGMTEFCGLELAVSPTVLIPRPETEILVQTAVSKLGKETRGMMLDVGTGCGAIALSLVHECPQLRGVAADVSGEALALARRNAEKTGLESRVEFRQGNLFEALRKDESFDLIVSNPPYIPTAEIPLLQAEVRWEPGLALDGGADGLAVIRKLAAEAPPFLKAGGWLVFEIGVGQEGAVRRFLEENGWKDTGFVNDMQGIPRVAQARR